MDANHSPATAKKHEEAALNHADEVGGVQRSCSARTASSGPRPHTAPPRPARAAARSAAQSAISAMQIAGEHRQNRATRAGALRSKEFGGTDGTGAACGAGRQRTGAVERRRVAVCVQISAHPSPFCKTFCQGAGHLRLVAAGDADG